MKSVLSLSFICFFSLFCKAQNEFANHWHFGEGHMDFSNGSPVIDTASSLVTFESLLSYSDSDGNLLFYSNLGKISSAGFSNGSIWNKNHEVMPNGNLGDTCGCESTSQGAIVIPDFTNPDLYLILMTDCEENIIASPAEHIGIRLTTVDMSLDGGLGDVVDKGVPVYGNESHLISEAITATRHANGIDYWLIAHSLNYAGTDTFYVFLVSATGISAPSVQKIGTPINYSYHLEFSPDGSKLMNNEELYDFDNSTGIISNPINLGYLVYATTFSPNSNLLYVTDGTHLYQHDLTSSDIVASKDTIYAASDQSTVSIVKMQLGPNCKIYITHPDQHFFGAINAVNSLGTDCNYVNNAVSYTSLNANSVNFPNYIDSEFDCLTASTNELFSETWRLTQSIDQPSITIYISDKLVGEKYSILDTQGKLISQEILISNETKVNINELPKGVYYILISKNEYGNKFIVY